jgi:hypothetical protein
MSVYPPEPNPDAGTLIEEPEDTAPEPFDDSSQDPD